ncbi:hypothetical protein [Rhodocaloribacter sp.]
MARWIDIREEMPEELAVVSVRVRGRVRPGYYRIEDRWYALVDLDRWRMKTSPYWAEDRAWYLVTEQIEAWLCEEEASRPVREGEPSSRA